MKKGFDKDDFKELLENDEILRIDDDKLFIEYMKPKSPDLDKRIGHIDVEEGLLYRFVDKHSSFAQKSGNLKSGVTPADWANSSKYDDIISGGGTDYTVGIDLMRKNLDEKPNLALGLQGDGLKNFATSKKAWQFGI